MFAPQGRAGNGVPASQPIQWSSEVWDSELGLVYYNWRYYNVLEGRWISYDIIACQNLFLYINPSHQWDVLGLAPNINYLPNTPRKNALSEYECAKRYITESNNFVIVAHGGPRSITGPDGNLMSPSELAEKMIQAGYKFDKQVKLIACNTGSLKDGFAQKLANHLHDIWKASFRNIVKNPRIIIAAPDTLTEIEYIDSDGILSYKVYPASEFGGISINPITNETTHLKPDKLKYQPFKPCE